MNIYTQSVPGSLPLQPEGGRRVFIALNTQTLSPTRFRLQPWNTVAKASWAFYLLLHNVPIQLPFRRGSQTTAPLWAQRGSPDAACLVPPWGERRRGRVGGFPEPWHRSLRSPSTYRVPVSKVWLSAGEASRRPGVGCQVRLREQRQKTGACGFKIKLIWPCAASRKRDI